MPQTFLDTVVQESLKVPARVWKAAFAALLETDFSGELGAINAPTLIIWGEQDAFFRRREQEALVAAIPGAQFIAYAGAGHGLHWEAPARCAADLATFVAHLHVLHLGCKALLYLPALDRKNARARYGIWGSGVFLPSRKNTAVLGAAWHVLYAIGNNCLCSEAVSYDSIYSDHRRQTMGVIDPL